jgi:hypothetical protein
MKKIFVIISSLLISVIAAADSGNNSCIDALHEKKVDVYFQGRDRNVYKIVGDLTGLDTRYTLSMDFNALVGSGRIILSNNFGANYKHEIFPLQNTIKAPRTIITEEAGMVVYNDTYNCNDAKEKKSCLATVEEYLQDLDFAFTQMGVPNVEQLKAMTCVASLLELMKKNIKK